MSTVTQFKALLASNGSDAIYHRDESTSPCPCRTPEGSRDPEWHVANPSEPVCNQAAYLPSGGTTVQITVKAFIQPIQSTRATRLSEEYFHQMFGEVEGDDHLGIFPCDWLGTNLEFSDWSQRGDDYIQYNGRKFLVVNANLIPDPDDGNPFHHWETGLRLISG